MSARPLPIPWALRLFVPAGQAADPDPAQRASAADWAAFRVAWRTLFGDALTYLEKKKIRERPFHEVRGATGSGGLVLPGMPSTFERWLERRLEALREECAADAEQLVQAALEKP